MLYAVLHIVHSKETVNFMRYVEV